MDSPRAQQTTDPRLLRASTYSRQECIDVLTDFLAYLSIRLPYLDPSWILKPPPTGWPNITQKSLRPLAKSEEVVQLLSLLPYAHVPGQTDPFSMHRRWTAIMRDTHLYDFHDEVYQTAMRKEEARNWIQQPFLDVPGWVICLTTGLSHGNWLLLDTSDGTITTYRSSRFDAEPDYASDDARAWRNECLPETKPIREFFQALINDYERLFWLPCFYRALPIMVFPEDLPETSKRVKQVYDSHGWPDSFRRDDCRWALIELGEKDAVEWYT